MAEGTVELTDKNWEAEVLKSDVPVLVDFWAPWCGPCRAIAPSIEQIAKEYKGKAKVGKLNTDDNPAVSQKYNIQSIPLLLVIKGGEIVGSILGAVPRTKIENELKQHLA